MSLKISRRALLAGCTALASTIGLMAGAYGAPALAAEAASSDRGTSLSEIVVTAQRREQNVQDVPIAVTALTQEAIAVNRVVTVNDLNLLAPGFNVVPTVGGTQIPSFSMRGITSYGVVPGSDKAISMYVDGVYISSARGSIFDLPDISQIEVLRGPQGTLFGRNATGGAVSITTRDPTGKFGVEQTLTGGNRSQFRSRTSIDLPAVGPFSAYVSYVHNQKHGDIENTGAGTVWDYSKATTSTVPKTEVSPKWLGSTKSNSVFAALKFEPTDNFSTVYKFDWTHDHGSPEGAAFLGADLSGPAGPTLRALLATNPVLTAGTTRPDKVNNAFAIPRIQHSLGHTLTSVYEGENFTIKNIAAYRSALLYTSDQLDGLGGLNLPVAPGVSLPFTVLGITNLTRSRQWSDELQYIYRSKLLTLTAGALAFESKDYNGAIPGLPNNVSFAVTPGNVIPAGMSEFFNKGKSIAAYAQIEVHVTSNFDIVGGVRETKDQKSGSNLLTPPAPPGIPAPASFKYSATRPSYLIGVNYKPSSETLVYAKYSTAFVSGGEVGGIPFVPETVDAWEVGFKGEFFDRHLRTNIALYDATYYHLQDSTGGGTYTGPLLAQYPFIPALGTFVVDQGGTDHSKGVEFEGTLLAAQGATVGSNISYTNTHFNNVSPAVDSIPGVPPVPTLLPKWTVGLWGQYEKSLNNDLKVTTRIDANWRSALAMNNPQIGVLVPVFAPYISVPSAWTVNGRATLAGLKMGGVDCDISVWAKNLTNDKSIDYALMIVGLTASATYVPARTFGVDLDFKY
jgi:iron complex outermembrane receptor protein